MTTESRFERQLPAILEDLYRGAFSRLSRRGPRRRHPDTAAAGLDLRRKVAFHG